MNVQWTKKGIIIEIPDSIDPDALREALEYLKKLQVSENRTYQKKGHVELENSNPEHNQANQSSGDNKNENNSNQSRLMFSDFSFSKSRNALENYKGSFSDAVIEERRTAL